MKTIVLIPTKNEEWIIDSTLSNISKVVDMIIIADQNSIDKTREICKKYKNTSVIENNYSGHSNKVRWLLLEKARKYGDGNLIICLDADEIISPEAITEMKREAEKHKMIDGVVFSLRWIQLYKDVHHHRNDGAWKNSWKNVAFIDKAGFNEYKKENVINDHTSRVPDTMIGKTIKISYPILHFHFLAPNRNQIKQAWYRCTELVAGKRNAKRINNTYRVTFEPKNITPIKNETYWEKDIEMPKITDIAANSWYYTDIQSLFNKFGILFFEDLQIWHINELREVFLSKTGRKPISKSYPAFLSLINDWVNFVKNKMLK